MRSLKLLIVFISLLLLLSFAAKIWVWLTAGDIPDPDGDSRKYTTYRLFTFLIANKFRIPNLSGPSILIKGLWTWVVLAVTAPSIPVLCWKIFLPRSP